MPKTAEKPAPQEPQDLSQMDLQSLAVMAEKGNARAHLELRTRIREKGEWGGAFHDMERTAETALIRRMCKEKGDGSGLLAEEHTRVRLRRMKEELAGPDPSTLVKALANRAALCWYQLNTEMALETVSNTPTEQEYHAKRQERAHRMYLSSLKALAQVRRLQLPMLQVNIAEKQINMQGG